MKIIDIKVMHGPNYWSVGYHNLVVMKLDLEELEFRPTHSIDGFSERLRQLMPNLYTHECFEGHPGGFFERVKDGTCLGHVIEHMALELQTLAGMNVGFGRTIATGHKGVYHVVIAFKQEKAGLFAARTAVEIAEALIAEKAFNIQEAVAALQQIKKETFPGPSTFSILEEARKRNIPVLEISPNGLYQLGYGKKQQRIRASMSSITGCIAVDIACDKDETKFLLSDAGIPVPKGQVVHSEEEMGTAIQAIGFPVVVKPLDGHQGKGITIDIQTLEEAKEALHRAHQVSRKVIIEQYIPGEDYRFLVINYKFVAASRRKPAAITGDGRSTIRQLIQQTNADPRRGGGHENILTQITVDITTECILQHKGLTLDSILPAGEELPLKKTANLSTGGTATDITEEVHPANIQLAERIARIIGLDICGIDISAPSVNVPISSNGGAVLEVNAAPGLRMHLSPSEGKPRNVAAPIMDMLFPEGKNSRIPIVSVTGTNGKTTVTRLIAHIARSAGHTVGFTTTDGIYINGQLVQAGDNTGPLSAKTILKDPGVDFAVLECARGGLLRAGLGFDQCDVGIVANVAADHLGLGDIHTLEQMAKVKSVIAETVHPEGYAILNADDDLVYEMHSCVQSKVAYFSMHSSNPRIYAHILSGGTAAVVENGYLTIYENHTKTRIARVADIPLSYKGTAGYMIANILPAVLACRIQGFLVEQIRQALLSFIPSPEMIPGRMNIFEFKHFRFMLDYAHNAAGLTAVGEFLQNVECSAKVGIIAGVGDRRDSDITDIGRIAAGIFDQIIIRLDDDLRDRTAHEIIELLRKGIEEIDRRKPVKIIPKEAEAICYAVKHAKPGSFVVNCSEKVAEAIVEINRLLQAEKQSSGSSHHDNGQVPQAASAAKEIRHSRTKSLQQS
jgi:cyanophycin synthetase